MKKHIPVARADELRPGQRKLVFVDGKSIVLFNIEGTIHAIENSCPHNGASLASGKLQGTVLQCPAHGLRFDLAKPCEPGSASLCLRRFPVRATGDSVALLMDGAGTP
ncbi:Rieske (2Fe-2S) protein [Cupriavidus oxalaticus]|uniref:Rieske (2Fe-2S) protein n=1 Tax=Cupriavidus oxalaticus TaxID=96344 RepID=UPI00316DDBDB